MKATFLIFALATSLFAIEKSDDNNFKILQKQIEHQLSVKGDAAGAATKCLLELKNESLNKEQKQIFQQLLNRSAIQSTDLLVVREAAAYLTTHNIPCNKLKQRLSLGLPENLNTNLNKNIREALDYQWNNLKWQTDKSDYEVFDGYLSELTKNTNVTECTRAQTTLLRTIILAYKEFADIIELDFKTVEKQYERLLLDLQCPKDKVKLIEVKKALNRYYETAREYLDKKHPYLAIAAIINLSYYSAGASTDKELKDISRVQINKLYKQTSSFVSEENIEPNLEKEKPYLFVIFNELSSCLAPQRITLRLEHQDYCGFTFVKLFDWTTGMSMIITLKPKIKELPLNIISITNSMYYKYANTLEDIVFPKEKLAWKQGENKEVKMGNQKCLVKQDWYYTVLLGKWNQVVWNERFSKLENDVLNLEPALNEIRKYVYDNYEKERIERKQKQLKDGKIRNDFQQEVKIFAEEGPKENQKAMVAKTKLLELMKKHPDFYRKRLVDALNDYPDKKYDMQNIYYIFGRPDYALAWRAWYFKGELKKLESIIEKEKDPKLISRYISVLFNDFDSFDPKKYPGISCVLNVIRYCNNNLSVTNLFPYVSMQLERISKGDKPKNKAIDFAEGIEACINSLDNEAKTYDRFIWSLIRHQTTNPHRSPDNWLIEMQCDSAKFFGEIINNYNLDKKIKAQKINDAINILAKSIRDCAYINTNNFSKATPIDYAEALDKNIPLIYNYISEIHNDYSLIINKFIMNNPPFIDNIPWAFNAQYIELRWTLRKYCDNPLPLDQQRKKLIIEKLMSFVRSVKADAGQSTNTVDWIVKFGLTNIFSKVEELDLPVDGYIELGDSRLFGFKDDKLRVASITHGTPVYKAGWQIGDVLISINGNDVKSVNEVNVFRDAVYKRYAPHAYLGIRRGDKELLYKIVKDQPDKKELERILKTKPKSNEDVFFEELKIFAKEGPKVNEKAMKARDKLLKILKSSELKEQWLTNILVRYPAVTLRDVNSAQIFLRKYNAYPNWIALQMMFEAHKLQQKIKSTQNPGLVIEFIKSFLKENSDAIGEFIRLTNIQSPAIYYDLLRTKSKFEPDVNVTNFLPLFVNDLKIISGDCPFPKDYILLNYIRLLNEWIPVGVKAEINGMNKALSCLVFYMNPEKFNWQAKARINLARKNIGSYTKLPKNIRIRNTVETLVELERGLREDAGLPTGKSPNPLYERGTDWVVKLGLTNQVVEKAIQHPVKPVVESDEEIFKKEIKIYIAEGPKGNEKAMKARDELLKILSKKPKLLSTKFVEGLKRYPNVDSGDINAIYGISPSDVTRIDWRIFQTNNETKKLLKKIESTKKHELIMEFLKSFLKVNNEFMFNSTQSSKFPALKTVYSYLQYKSSGKESNINVTNFIPLLANELKRISGKKSFEEKDILSNYIILIDEWIPVGVNAEQNGMKNSLAYVVDHVDSSRFDWQAKARIDLARNNIFSYAKLPECKRILKTVEALVELQRGLSEDAGQSTNIVDWVAKLGLTNQVVEKAIQHPVKPVVESDEEIFKKEMKIFVEEGPKENDKVMKARKELLKILSKNPKLASQALTVIIKKYPNVTSGDTDEIWRYSRNDTSFREWQIFQVNNEAKKLLKRIESTENPELIMEFINSFLKDNEVLMFNSFQISKLPAYAIVYSYLQSGSSGKESNINVTNFMPLLVNELKRISDKHSFKKEDILSNYIMLLGEWIPAGINAEQNGMKNSLAYVVDGVSSSKFDWQAKARIDLAKRNINSYKKLSERKKILKTVESLVELEKGLREDTGQSTNIVDWVKKCGLDRVDIKEFYELKKVYFPKRPLKLMKATKISKVFSPKRPVKLMKATKISSGVNLQLKLNGKTQFKKEGQIISHDKKDLYKIGKADFKKEGVWNKLINSTQYIDKSSVEIENLQTGEKFTLTIGEESHFKTAEAILLQLADNKETTVKVGDKVPLDDKKTAKITNINVKDQTVAFVTGSETNVLKSKELNL